MSEKIRMHILAIGMVQGVGFRWFVQRIAQDLEIFGWVRNLPNGNVEIEAEGVESSINKFIDYIKMNHPYARVKEVQVNAIPVMGDDSDFNIIF